MVERRIERRLAAILAADVVGYSRLMGADETGTFDRLKALQHEVFNPLTEQYGGLIFKTTGDGALAEFPSSVDAVHCAIDVQRQLNERNVDLEPDRRIELRIGINVGDVIIDKEDRIGDGVNIAARLETLAQAGEICISVGVYQHVKVEPGLSFEDLGEQTVKNIAEPIRVYRVSDGKSGLKGVASRVASRGLVRSLVPVAIGTTIILAAGAYYWTTATGPRQATQMENSGVDQQETSTAASVRHEGPSIAVLPFQNMSEDASQNYFADGIAEDVITDLSKISGLFVIARNTSFQFRGGSVDVIGVGRKLGVRYVLEGSVRRAGDKVRINAQLIDAMTGGHVWAERYDGSLVDVFSAQDQVTSRIIDALKLQLTPAERVALATHGTNNPAAYDAYLRGLELLSERKRLDAGANQAAQAEFKKAAKIDPDYSQAIAGLAWAKWLHHETISDLGSVDEAFELAAKSIKLSNNALAHRTLSKKHFSLQTWWSPGSGDMHAALSELEQAQQLQPNDPDILADLATVLCFTGQPGRALKLIQKAASLNPDHPKWYLGPMGIALMLNDDPAGAAKILEAWSQTQPSWHLPYLFLAAAMANAGEDEDAKAALARFNKLLGYKSTFHAIHRRWPMAPEQEAVFFKGLRKAGVKDTPG